MKDSIYKNLLRSVNEFDTPLEAYKYYDYMLKNNSEKGSYPKELRECHKGLLIGLKYHLTQKELEELK
jgi:hypothetical protein